MPRRNSLEGKKQRLAAVKDALKTERRKAVRAELLDEEQRLVTSIVEAGGGNLTGSGWERP